MAEPEDGAYHRAVTQGSGRGAARSTAIVVGLPRSFVSLLPLVFHSWPICSRKSPSWVNFRTAPPARAVGGERAEVRPERRRIHRRNLVRGCDFKAASRDVEVEPRLHDEDAVFPPWHESRQASLNLRCGRNGSLEQRNADALSGRASRYRFVSS